MISPTTPATIYGFNDQLISMPLITLTAYKIAICSIAKHGLDPTPDQQCEKIVRKLLQTPKGYPIEHIAEHLTIALKETKEHYGIE